MTEAEVNEFLQSERSLSLASMGSDGGIHLVAMWYGFLGDLVGVQTKAKSQKVANLRRDPRMTVLVESGGRYNALRGVEILGEAEILDAGSDHMIELCTSVYRRNAAEPAEDVEAAVERMMYKRVGIVLHPKRVVSWDHAKLKVPG